MRNDAATVPAFDANDREYGLLLRGGRAHTFRSHPRGATFEADFPAASTRLGSETVYEMALPWSDLGRKPAPGMVFSLNVVAIDNDGAGADILKWFGLLGFLIFNASVVLQILGNGLLPALERRAERIAAESEA